MQVGRQNLKSLVLNRPDSHPGEVPSRHTTLFGHDDDDDVGLNVRLGCRVDILGTNCDQRVCMVQCCFTSTKTIRLVRTESSSELTLFGHAGNFHSLALCTTNSGGPRLGVG